MYMQRSCSCASSQQCSTSYATSAPGQWPRTRSRAVSRRAVDKDVDWEPATKTTPTTAPPRTGFTRPPPPPPPQPGDWGLWEAPFSSRRNIALSILAGSSLLWVYNKKVLPPVEIGQPPKDFPFKLAGYTDVAPEEFVYAKTPGGNWVAAAQDPQGRLYMIDQVGDLYYDSGNPEIGMYVVDTQGDMYNIYRDTDGSRKVTPVGNISDMRSFKVNEIAGLKLDSDVQVVAMQDGNVLPLPPNVGTKDADGKFTPPASLVEGVMEEKENPFAKLLQSRRDREFPLYRYDLDLKDPTPFDRQIFDQTLFDDPDIPGQPALPDDFDMDALKKEVEQEMKQRKR